MKHINILILICSIFMLQDLQAVEQASLKITANSSVIIVVAKSPTPTAKFAAEDLMRCLIKSLNCRVKITASPISTDKDDIFIYVGPSDFTSGLPLNTLKPEHFFIKVCRQKIFLVGQDDSGCPLAQKFTVKTGTMYAVYTFLQKFFGIRWLWPGDLGEIIPSRKTVSIPYMNKVMGPRFLFRYTDYNYSPLYDEKSKNNLVLWGRRNGLGRGKYGTMGHSESGVMGDKYYNKHPEYYALRKGKRVPLSESHKLCHSNPELPKIYAEWGIKSGLAYFSASPDDGRGWCECAECRKLDGPNPIRSNGHPNTSGRVFTFVNRIAKELKRRNSEQMVATYAYADYVNPPENIKQLEDNVLLGIARGIYWNYAPTWKAEFKTIISKWAEKCSSIVLRDYKDNLRPMQISPYPKLVAENINYLMGTTKNFQGINFCGDDSRDYSLLGPTMYVYAKLLWNPETKLEDILTEYYKAGWPNAHKYIREYFEFFENRTAEMSRKHDISLYSWKGGEALNILPAVFNKETLEKGRSFLNSAYVIAKSKTEKDRVDFLRIGLQAVENDMDYYNALLALSNAGECFYDIPSNHEKCVSLREKKELINQACQAMEKRLAFLIKHKNSEAIPSVLLTHPKFDCSSDNLLKKLKHDFARVEKVLEINDPWKFSLDPKSQGKYSGWFKPEYDDTKWANIKTTTFWEKQGYGSPENYDGWAWYRKWVRFPKQDKPGNLTLVLGAVDDSYDLYINGELIRQFRYNAKNPDSWKQPQKIFLNKNVIKWGKNNLLAVAVHDREGLGGIWRPCFFQIKPNNLIYLKMPEWLRRRSKGINIIMNDNDPQIAEVTINDNSVHANIELTVENVKGDKTYELSFKIQPKINKAKISSLPEEYKKFPYIRYRIVLISPAKKLTYIWSNLSGSRFLENDWMKMFCKFKTPESIEKMSFTIFFASPGTYKFRDISLIETE